MRCNYLYIAILFISFLLGSCNLFETRDPEDPETNNETLPTAFTSDILFDNFQKSFQQKNLGEYEKLFSDTAAYPESFLFVPITTLATRFLLWDINSEKKYFGNAIESVDKASTFQFFPAHTQIVTYQSDSTKYSFEYELFIPHTRADITTKFEGRCELLMAPGKNQIWKIYRWVDYETKKDSSWSELKGYFAK